MREILFRGKRICNGVWVEGGLIVYGDGASFVCSRGNDTNLLHKYAVKPSTLGQYTGLKDKNGKRIFEGDILKYKSNDGSYDCIAVVKFGEYEQDGSGGEYSPRRCLGFYVEVINVASYYDWNDTECFPDYYRTQSLLEVVDGCEVIGNIYDNYDLLEEPT